MSVSFFQGILTGSFLIYERNSGRKRERVRCIFHFV